MIEFVHLSTYFVLKLYSKVFTKEMEIKLL